jgi:hypothetical protein
MNVGDRLNMYKFEQIPVLPYFPNPDHQAGQRMPPGIRLNYCNSEINPFSRMRPEILMSYPIRMDKLWQQRAP